MFLTRSRRKVYAFLKILWMTVGFLVVCALIPPARNLVGYFFLPGAWRPLSTFQIIYIYFADPLYPAEETKVFCDDIQGQLKTVQWQKLVGEMENFQVYDSTYFDKLQKHAAEYGTSEKDLMNMENRYYRYKPSMTSRWQREMTLTFKMLVHVMDVFKVPYFLAEGSMLGAYRHHGFIPWDDDMDICINVTYWFKVKQILHCVPDFDVSVENKMIYKFFWKHSPLWKRETNIRYPFIDIFFFNEDREYLWAITSFKKNRILFSKSDIFPLTYRPFENSIVPVPRNIDKICNTVYNPNDCMSRFFDHMDRHFIPFYKVEHLPCKTFYRVYPFVFRKDVVINGRSATVEYRKLGNKVISNYTVYH